MHLIKKEKEETLNLDMLMKIEKEETLNSFINFVKMDKDEKVHQSLISGNFFDSLKKYEIKFGMKNNLISGLSLNSSVNKIVKK